MTTRISLRPLLKQNKIIPLLVADTPQTALALHQSGAKAAAVGGFSISAVQGRPDDGTMRRDEYLSLVAPVLNAAPQTAFVIDGEAGFGNPAEFISLIAKHPNASMIFIEDQVPTDKRCGHMDRHALVSVEEMQNNIREAVSAQINGEPMIMARTDARSAEGSIEAAIDRAKAYVEAGADALFVEAPRSVEELKLICESFPDTPLLANVIEGGKTPELSASQLEELGFSLVVRPVSVSLVYSKIVQEMISDFYGSGSLESFYRAHGKPELEDFRTFIGLNKS
ncbi:MAG: isocitrate lyase/PEP mutase family protein [Bdellovibrionales bacterium]|nr:isocitrate lyase/PEP mutase family protein [Bdellovibrionales bacterium]